VSERDDRGRRQRGLPRGEASTEVIEIGVVSPVDRPTIAEDESLEFDERVRTTSGDRRVPEYAFQLCQAGQSGRQIEIPVTVVRPLLSDPFLPSGWKIF